MAHHLVRALETLENGTSSHVIDQNRGLRSHNCTVPILLSSATPHVLCWAIMVSCVTGALGQPDVSLFFKLGFDPSAFY